MDRTSPTKELDKALLEFQKDVYTITIKKDASNPFHKSKYATLNSILSEIVPRLNQLGLFLSQEPTTQEEGKLLTLTTEITHVESGQKKSSTYSVVLLDPKPQTLGSAITYLRRYALVPILGLNIEDDDDGNAASARKSPQAPREVARPVAKNNTEVMVDNALKAGAQAKDIDALKVVYEAYPGLKENKRFVDGFKLLKAQFEVAEEAKKSEDDQVVDPNDIPADLGK